MAISSTSLDYISAAIKSSTKSSDDSKSLSSNLIKNNTSLSSFNSTKSKDSSSNQIATISKAAAEIVTLTKYKTAYEDMISDLKDSNESTDKITYDDIKSYAQKKAKSESFTYDYASIKAQRQENQAKIEAEVAEKYSKTNKTAQS